MMRLLKHVAIGLLFLVAGIATAQESLADVYVTVQRNASLRAGPDTSWDQLAFIPYGETFRATGRTLDANWIQIAYDGELLPDARNDATIDGITYGWVASWLLNWSGNILELPVDGVETAETVRAAGAVMLITPGTRIYQGSAGPEVLVDFPLEGPSYVELSGRLGGGESGYLWVQFKTQGQFYWTSIIVRQGVVNFPHLPDVSYLFSFGRLSFISRRNLDTAGSVLADIGGRWRALAAGQPTSCNEIPADVALRVYSESDLQREYYYVPLANAFVEVESALNRALTRFRTVCAEGGRSVDPANIQAALEDIVAAERNLNIASLLLPPIILRDPTNQVQ